MGSGCVAAPAPWVSPGNNAPSPVPTLPSAQPSALAAVARVRGTVYDEAGEGIRDGARVRIQSIHASAPFDQTVEAQGGQYMVEGVPLGVQLAVSATKDGWTSRTRLVVFVSAGEGRLPQVDFGGPGSSDDKEAPAFYLSDYPEISEVEPAPGTTLEGDRMPAYVLKLSEPLPEADRRRFAQALRLLPANRYASPRLLARDLSGPAAPDYQVSDAAYMIAQGTTFLDPEEQATVTWDVAGQVATFKPNVPLLASGDGAALYQVVLAATGEVIRDASGHALGTAFGGARDTYPAEQGRVIHHAFRSPALANLTLAAGLSPAQRWAATHESAAGFLLPRDKEAPTLVGARLSRASERTRLHLTFSEPLVAYDGTKEGRFTEGYRAIANYSFAVARSTEALSDVHLDGVPQAVLTGSEIGFGAETHQLGDEFTFADADIALDPANGRTVIITLDSNRLFDEAVRAIRVRAMGVGDPAGNALDDDEADEHSIIGRL